MADKQDYSTAQIVAQLETQWSATDISYRQWDETTVEYFIGDTTVVGGGKTGESKGWTAMAADQTAAATEAFDIWNELIANIDLVATTILSDAEITFAYSTTTTKDGTYTTPTIGSQSGSEAGQPDYPIDHQAVWMDANTANWPDLATGIFATFSNRGLYQFEHEIGHSLGLSHPDLYNATDATAPTYDTNATFLEDQRKYTIMSYFGSESTDSSGWTTTGNGLNDYYSSTPMVYDIAAIQQKYGADYTTRNGNTTYGYNSDAGWDFFDFSKNTRPVFTIWDGGGTDTIDASGYDKAQKINLTPGSYSSILGLTDNIAVALEQIGDGRALIENAIGGSGDDALIGNYGQNHLVGNGGDDQLYGMTGADVLDGGAGDDLLDGGGTGNGTDRNLTDVLTGGAGSDTFVYGSGYHQTIITDFSMTDDSLDLTLVPMVHDLAGLMGYAQQVGNDLVFNFGYSLGSRDQLVLQNMTYSRFSTINPLSVAIASAPPGIEITPNPSDNLSTMYVSVAPLAGGGFVATRFSYVDVVNHQILAFRYDSTGALVDSVQVNITPSDALQVRAIGLGSGKTIVVWDSPNGGAGGEHAVLARLLDETGTPIGDVFTVNQTHFSPGGASLGLSITASPNGGADIEYYVQSSLMENGATLYFTYRAGISADGSVVGENNLGSDYHGTYGNNVNYTYAFKDFDYYVQTGTDGKYHAYYKEVGHTAVQLDNGDFFLDGVGLDQPPFQAMQLTDGRILFSYLSGYTFGYSQVVNGDKVVIVNADGYGFTKPGTEGDDYLQGGPGNDKLYGHGGNDVFLGLSGGDLLDGGDGTDTAAYTRSTAGVTIDLRLTGPQGGAGDGAGDTLVSIENLIGSDLNDKLDGDAGPNRIEGGKGDDIINGNGSSDMLLGGGGNDTIVLTANVGFNDTITEAQGGDGNDTITINGDNALAYGDAGDDTIIINGNHNIADGGSGNNTLKVIAGSGNILEGGDDNDILTGGSGNNTLYGGNGDDIYVASSGSEIYYDWGGTNDTIIYHGDMVDYTISYDPSSDTLTIRDTRNGSPDGISTITGIDIFTFHDGSRTLAQVIAAAGAPGVPGQVVDGYVAGATVFADADGDHVLDAGEISTTTDGQGNYTIASGGAPLVAVGGTDIATGLAFQGFMSAPSDATVITPLTTLVELLAESGVTNAVDKLLQALGLPPGTDLLHIDPVAANAAGDVTAFALLVAGAAVISDVALLAAGLEAQTDATAITATESAYAALTSFIASNPTLNLTDATQLQQIVTLAGLSGDTASGVLAALSSTNTQIHAAPDTTALTTAQTNAQGLAADTLATPTAPAVSLAHDTGTSTTDHITKDAALTVTPAEAGGTIGYTIDGNAAASYDPATLAQGNHTIGITQTNASGHVSAATSFTFTYDSVAPDLMLDPRTGQVFTDYPIEISGTVGVEDAGRTIQIMENSSITGTAVAGIDGAWHGTITLHGAGDHGLLISATDLAGNTDEIATEISVRAANRAPTTGADQATTPEHTPLVLSAAKLLSNDADPDGDTLSVIGVSNATHGTVSFDAAHDTVTFTPTAGYSGAATFNYTISDGNGGIATGTVGVTVTAGSVGGGWGDVHYTTLDGMKYDLMSLGDYVIAHATSGSELEIQGRAENLGKANLSYLTAIAVDAGGHLVVYDEATPSTMLIDGHAVAFAVGDKLDLGDGVVVGRATSTTHQITTSLDFVEILDHKTYLDISVHAGATRASGSFEGLLGNFDGNAKNDFILQNGSSLLSPSKTQIEHQFGDTWRVSAGDDMLSALSSASIAQRISDAAHNHVETMSVHDWHFG